MDESVTHVLGLMEESYTRNRTGYEFPCPSPTKENTMPDEINLPSWVIRRYVVVNDRKVDTFETFPGATAHREKHGGEIRELEFRLSKIRTTTPRVEGWVRADGE